MGIPRKRQNRDNVENWAEAEGLSLMHNSKRSLSFNSGRWKKSYNPDLTLVSEKINAQTVKKRMRFHTKHSTLSPNIKYHRSSEITNTTL